MGWDAMGCLSDWGFYVRWEVVTWFCKCIYQEGAVLWPFCPSLYHSGEATLWVARLVVVRCVGCVFKVGQNVYGLDACLRDVRTVVSLEQSGFNSDLATLCSDVVVIGSTERHVQLVSYRAEKD